jgi:transposase
VATRRRFTQEYKDQAVSLVLDSGRTIAEVAKSIGVHEMTLGKWVKKAKESGAPNRDLSETERAELERLRKENTTLRMERYFAKSCRLVRERTAVKYAAIADWAADKQYPVTFMCAQLGLARQGYYRWLARGDSQRERSDAELTEQIRQIHHQLHGHPGVRRVWAELVVQGDRVARRRVWRLMRAEACKDAIPRPGSAPPSQASGLSTPRT